MRLSYETPVEPGTIVHHNQAEPELFKRFLAVEDSACTIRLADPHTEVYAMAQGGIEPRSIVEWHILRRTWTPYGYAKVWGSTPQCSPPQAGVANPRKYLSQIFYRNEAASKVEECTHWYRVRHPSIVDEMQPGTSYIKAVNTMYRNMING